MNRRRFGSFSASLLASSCLGLSASANALSVNDLTNAQASQGLKLALEKGAIAAVQLLGRPDGFLGNDKVRIPLPGFLQDTARLLRSFGQGARLDELIVAMNRAAETAVPLARDMLVGAVKTMNVKDAKKILTGGDTSVTQFFAERTRQPLGRKFLPVVARVTSRVNLADKYNQVAGKAAGMGLLKGDQTSIEQYVTAKTLDGIYFMIGEEEKKIRQDPVGTGSALLQKVFGALRP
ncbi:DUF4197 domain-containing protein [Rhodoferax sp.]|uniref:DUF4197 domain-containing protein n=1 Tax=Rhodoferax sp. TaxID=50421 RepID=UPI00260FBB7B|nr:DUF4197 domain-containing protein [Rhodoferax sp.]MDD2918878.1 DUF4197 domain-containing protein [Rhodoferax sp.]